MAFVELKEIITKMFQGQKLGVLISQAEIYPYPTLVAFHNSQDLTTIICATSKKSKKFDNITKSPNVSFLLNDSRNAPDDFSDASVVTAFGTASCLERRDVKKDLVSGLEHKHPKLNTFFGDPDTVFIVIKVERYQVIREFQKVHEFKP